MSHQPLAVPRLRGLLPRLAVEAVVVGVLFVLYNLGRLSLDGHEEVARRNAGLVRDAQSVLGLPSEAQLQGALLGVPDLLVAANHYYVGLHFPVTVVFLVWGFLARPRTEYTWARNLLAILTFLGLALHVAFPLAPPRMFPEWGFVDSMAAWGPSAYDGASAAVANQYAAMPSLHIGWALLIAFVLVRTGPRPLAAAGVLHAATTVLVVVVTANHWWFDGLVAALLLGIAVWMLPRPGVPVLARLGGGRSRSGALGAAQGVRG
ncbi:MAG: phosphatase PAP2 family protein [Nocardioides marinisabuli]|uniref:phosphatase PAP2 family protein n=1 Tax=Nocardioides marinisabuli TaxID=419476 RepID=UPI003219A911